jgi:IMP dehydrogenase
MQLTRANRISGVPVVDGNELVGIVTARDLRFETRMQAPVSEIMTPKERLVTVPEGAERELVAGVDVIVVDTAHGHSQGVLDRVRWIKQHYPDVQVIGGNIATGEAARDLIEAGADAVKVGHRARLHLHHPRGRRRRRAADHRHHQRASRRRKAGVPVIADGGVRFSGDVAKAIAAGRTP